MVNSRAIIFLRGVLVVAFLFTTIFYPQSSVYAAASLSIEPITWNVIGLDSNNVTVGPNNFPVGARVCNTGDAIATDVKSAFVFDDGTLDTGTPVGNLDLFTGDTYINLRLGSKSSYTENGVSLTPGACKDFYYEVDVNRNSNAYDQIRRYYITAGIGSVAGVSTPQVRELYVEHLISQNRNSTNLVCFALGTDPTVSPCANPAQRVGVGGNLNLQVGNTYVIELQASTATQGYNQLEDFINFPNTIFQVLDVYSTYSADSSGYVSNSSDKLYADACLWEMDPLSPEYLSCIGSDGKVGGTISTAYVVKIVSGAGTSEPLNTLIYDFSGSSFHYNSDFSSSTRFAFISSPLTMSKSFAPASIAAAGTSTLSIAITNSGATAVSGVSLTDTLPTAPSQMSVAGTPSATIAGTGCTGTFLPGSGATSISVTGLTVPGNTTCTLNVSVQTAGSLGTYVNNTGNLLINSADTGVSASANLMVESVPSATCSSVPIANWTISGATAPPVVTTKDGSVTALAFSNGVQDNNGTWWRITDTVSGTTNPIGLATDKYFRFQIDTSIYSNVKMTFSYSRGNQGPVDFDMYYGNSATISATAPLNPVALAAAQYTPTTGTQTVTNLDFTGLTNTAGSTYFFLYAYNAGNQGINNWIGINNITFSGCRPGQSIAKNFVPDPIAVGGTSTLTFTLTNQDAINATGAAFTDTLPMGMTVKTTAVTPQCGGVVSAVAGSSVIGFSGGTIPLSGSCTVVVDVTADSSQVFSNVSSYLTANATVVNSKATDTLTVLDPPVIEKSFSPNPIYSGGESTLTFSIRNPNPSLALTGVAFTDDMPADLTTTAAPTTPQCGGTVSTALIGGQYRRISLSGGTIPAGGTCTVTVPASSSKVATYVNTTGSVTATETGPGNIASDTLVVQAVYPSIGILKEVSDSPSGPWAHALNVEAGANVYYRISIENTGDVPLSPVSVTDIDPAINLASCTWPSTLPVGTSTVSPIASCIVSPPTVAVAGGNSNTATAHGTYNGVVYDSPSDTAVYATTDLVLAKIKNPINATFTTAGDIITFNYTITNNGAAPLTGTLSITDSNTVVIVDGTTCPGWTGTLGVGASITCSASYTVTAFDVSVGSVTNTAYAKIGAVRSNSDRETVFANKEDLTVTKTNNTSDVALINTQFGWTITVKNQGPVDAQFLAGEVLLSDQLPATGATYGLPTVGTVTGISGTGTISCSINGSFLLTCSAAGGDVILAGSTGTIPITVSVTPTLIGSLSNPLAQVDPGGAIAESDEGNNTAGDSVAVNGNANLGITKTDGVISVAPGATVTYTITISNAGPTAADEAKFVDPLIANLTVTGVTCGTPTGGAVCPSAANTTVALMQGIGITLPTLPSGSSIPFTVTSTAGAAGTSIANAAFAVAPAGITDPTPGNNSATDTDTIDPQADLTITKTDGVTNVNAGGSTSYTVRVTNNGPSTVTGAVLSDVAAAGLSKTAVVCSGTPGQCVTAPTIIQLESGTFALPVLTSGQFYEITVTATVSATSGSIVNVATIAVPAGTNDPTPGNNSATDTDSLIVYLPPTVTKSFGATSIQSGGNTTMTLTLGNPAANPGALTTIQVDDIFPIGMTLQNTTFVYTPAACGSVTNTAGSASSVGDGAIRFTVFTLANGSTCQVVVNVAALTAGLVTNTTAAPTATGPVVLTGIAASDDLSVTPLVDLSLTKVVDDLNPNIGDKVNFTITITNHSLTVAATNVEVVDLLPSGLTFNLADSDFGTGTYDEITGKWVIPSLAAGASDTLKLNVTITALGLVTNIAEITKVDQTDPDSIPNNHLPTEDDQASVSIGSVFDPPSGIKTFNDIGLPEMEFRMVWINSGNTASVNTQVIDNIPVGTAYVNGSLVCSPQGVSANAGAAAAPLNMALANSFCAFDSVNNRIQWQGSIGPDNGHLTEATALNEVVITFRVSVNDSTDSILNVADARTDANNDGVFTDDVLISTSGSSSNQVAWDRTLSQVKTLPKTGFIPETLTMLPEQPIAKVFTATDLRLEIPRMNVNIPVVGIPLVGNEWDVSWLWQEAGWLNGTAFPGWSGNSALTSHVTLSNGKPGPFARLGDLKWGDKIIVRAYGSLYTYEVRENRTISSYDTSVLKHEEEAWITLLTCKTYNEKTHSYTNRISVRAVLLKVEKQSASPSNKR